MWWTCADTSVDRHPCVVSPCSAVEPPTVFPLCGHWCTVGVFAGTHQCALRCPGWHRGQSANSVLCLCLCCVVVARAFDSPRVLPRLLPYFVCLEVSFGNFSMTSFVQPTLINMLFDSFEISSKLLMQHAVISTCLAFGEVAISSIIGMSFEKSTLLSLRCDEINFRLESEFLSVPVPAILWPSCTKDRLVRVALGSSVASSSFSNWIVSWMTRSSCSSGVGRVRALCVEDRIELGAQFFRAGWVSFASALDSAILQLALHAAHLDTEVIVDSVWSRSSSSNSPSPLSLSLCSNHALVALDRMTAQCSSHSHWVTCPLLRVSHSRQQLQCKSLHS